jgi:LysM repeat protein
MQFWSRTVHLASAGLLVIVLNGCLPSEQSDADDTKEPHFILGQSRVNAMDYQGAIDAFEQSLEANPRSAQAHYQLAMLYEQHVPDPAAAIYHYQQYLKFDPKAPNADVVSDHINSCKQQLASDVMAMPTAPAAIRQIEQLTDANEKLQMQVAYYSNQLVAAKLNTTVPQNNPPPQTVVNQISPQPAQNVSANQRPRTHTVVSGETAAAIARKIGVKLSALQSANPGVNLSKLKVNQVLNLPPP